MAMAWALMNVNIALIVWIGTGGMMAAFAGPLVVGALWRGVTAAGAYAGLIGGFATFLILHTGQIDPDWFPAGSRLQEVALWLRAEAPNPYSCAAIGELVSIALTWGVSRRTRPLPADHVEGLFGSSGG
jgi:Na+/proline symporter